MLARACGCALLAFCGHCGGTLALLKAARLGGPPLKQLRRSCLRTCLLPLIIDFLHSFCLVDSGKERFHFTDYRAFAKFTPFQFWTDRSWPVLAHLLNPRVRVDSRSQSLRGQSREKARRKASAMFRRRDRALHSTSAFGFIFGEVPRFRGGDHLINPGRPPTRSFQSFA